MTPSTADLYDKHGPKLQVLEMPLPSYGAATRFEGRIATLKVYEDNTKVREALAQPGQGRVLVVDGAGSRRYALVGDRIAQLAVDNDWAGLVVNGCIRDSALIKTMPLGVRALGTTPRKTEKRGSGLAGVEVTFGGVGFRPGAWLCADEDGVVVSEDRPSVD